MVPESGLFHALPVSPPNLCRYASRFAGRSGNHTDGCLTCWRADRFQEVGLEEINFNLLDLRDNVALLVLLRPVGPPIAVGLGKAAASQELESLPLLLVANTHLLFNPKRGDIKVRWAGASRASRGHGGQSSQP